jgi:hypothetical protein
MVLGARRLNPGEFSAPTILEFVVRDSGMRVVSRQAQAPPVGDTGLLGSGVNMDEFLGDCPL